jgi:thiol-disulfide isomerase/thioredoxin
MLLPVLLTSIALLATTADPAVVEDEQVRVGSKLESVAIHDAKGKSKTLKLTEGKGTALIFVSEPNCPAGEPYTAHIARLQSDYEGKGIRFVFVNPTTNAAAVRLLGAKRTPEMFLFDEAGTLVYQGRVDQAPSDSPVAARSARAAIEAVLAKESVKEPEVPVEAGCPVWGQTAMPPV